MAKLLSGGSVPDDSVLFDSGRYHFTSGFDDITNDLSRAEKERLVSGFDVTRENYRLSAELGHGAAYGQVPLSESTLAPLADQLVTDPFSAPIESLGRKADQFFGTGGIVKLLLFGGLLVGLYVFIAGGWFKRP
jgi:hypothetical protein